jgi:hypothetical protein
MNVEAIRKVVGHLSTRSTWQGIAACLVLAVLTIWTVRLTREALDRADAAEKSAEQARTDAAHARAQLDAKSDPAIRRSRHDDPREIARVRQLHAEIEGLTHIEEQIEQRLGGDRTFVPKKAPPTPVKTVEGLGVKNE